MAKTLFGILFGAHSSCYVRVLTTGSMSTASKITLGVSCLFALSAFIGVHISQALERELYLLDPFLMDNSMNQSDEKLVSDGHRLSVSILFDNPLFAAVAMRSLSVDPSPPRSTVKEQLNQEGSNLICTFIAPVTVSNKSQQLRKLRIAVNSWLDHVTLISETINAFGITDSSFSSERAINGF
ncbi:Nuclear migration nudC [Schistosoma japonicum]|uniref:Nuclear migration nudC n=2 Tax=Schistosoma japonicum TaxID=6182 RepID=A0A4Z2D0R4_SCHJA|nr:Nuclear migration nudC [Schistosoma japonicum]